MARLTLFGIAIAPPNTHLLVGWPHYALEYAFERPKEIHPDSAQTSGDGQVCLLTPLPILVWQTQPTPKRRVPSRGQVHDLPLAMIVWLFNVDRDPV